MQSTKRRDDDAAGSGTRTTRACLLSYSTSSKGAAKILGASYYTVPRALASGRLTRRGLDALACRLLGNDGERLMQPYFVAMPEPKQEIGRRLDGQIVLMVPRVKKAARRRSAIYGVERMDWEHVCV